MYSLDTLILLGVTVVVVIIIVVAVLLPLLCSYRVDDHEIAACFLGLFEIMSFSLARVVEVKVENSFNPLLFLWKYDPFRSLRFVNCPWATKCVVVRRRGVISALLFTPKDPEEFAAAVHRGIAT